MWEVSFPGGTSGKEPPYLCSRHKTPEIDPWVRKMVWRRAWQPTPVFLPGESPWTEEPGGLQFMGSQRVGHKGSELACSQCGKHQCSEVKENGIWKSDTEGPKNKIAKETRTNNNNNN